MTTAIWLTACALMSYGVWSLIRDLRNVWRGL